jgi:DNA-binding NtrC family response regulator
MQSILVSQQATFGTMPSLVVMEPDSIQRKGIAVAVLDHFDEVRLTGSLAEAVRCVREKPFTVALLGLDPGSPSAMEALAAIRAAAPAIQIILTVSQTSGFEGSELDRLGVRSVLERPLDLGRLMEILRDLTNPR